ncbi:TfoX/Sxy family protein [[Acholeplasma] multilocale]|uniref:TfoX/Sxy family protein n=1 Tax=[Acholeplasma] multilocale TaxID=264638 RepID=UPI000425F287|nr:TfoX/Sxy family protein [[Acholeplasma] multilocale]
MPTSKGYFNFIKEQFSEYDEVGFRSMMGEYAVYYKGKTIGAIFDDILLVKPVKTALEYVREVDMYASPKFKVKEMLVVDDVEDIEYVIGLFETMYDEVPFPKTKKK